MSDERYAETTTNILDASPEALSLPPELADNPQFLRGEIATLRDVVRVVSAEVDEALAQRDRVRRQLDTLIDNQVNPPVVFQRIDYKERHEAMVKNYSKMRGILRALVEATVDTEWMRDEDGDCWCAEYPHEDQCLAMREALDEAKGLLAF